MLARLTKTASVTTATVMVALLVTGAGTATAASARSGADTASDSAAAACRTADLAASVHKVPGQAGAGNIGALLALTNASHRTCRVYGYPGLGLQNAQHKVQSIKVVWGATYFDRDPGRHTVTLAPGHAAYAGLGWNAPYGTKSVTPAYLEVTPPDQTSYRVIRFAPGPIGAGALHVTALAATPPSGTPGHISVSVKKFTNNGPVNGPLRPGDTADVIVSGCDSGVHGLATSRAFTGGSVVLLPSADRPTLQGFPRIAKVSGTFTVTAQCPDIPTLGTTTITVK